MTSERRRLNAAAPYLREALRECLALLREIDPSDTTLTEHAGYVALAMVEGTEAYSVALAKYEAALNEVAA